MEYHFEFFFLNELDQALLGNDAFKGELLLNSNDLTD